MNAELLKSMIELNGIHTFKDFSFYHAIPWAHYLFIPISRIQAVGLCIQVSSMHCTRLSLFGDWIIVLRFLISGS